MRAWAATSKVEGRHAAGAWRVGASAHGPPLAHELPPVHVLVTSAARGAAAVEARVGGGGGVAARARHGAVRPVEGEAGARVVLGLEAGAVPGRLVVAGLAAALRRGGLEAARVGVAVAVLAAGVSDPSEASRRRHPGRVAALAGDLLVGAAQREARSVVEAAVSRLAGRPQP